MQDVLDNNAKNEKRVFFFLTDGEISDMLLLCKALRRKELEKKERNYVKHN